MMFGANSVPTLWVELVNKLYAMHVAQSSFAVFDATEKPYWFVILYMNYEKVFKDFKHSVFVLRVYIFST